MLCGADHGVEIAEFGQAKAEWLGSFLALPNGIPSHDTLGRVFSRRDPEQLPAGFLDWVRSISELTQGEVVALDGKTLRGSGDRGSGPRPRVSAWAAANRLTRGQVKTAAKSNEITAIPQLLARLDLRGCLVTIDAMGCQKSIARQIVASEADYLLAVKSNQGQLYDQRQDAFRCAEGSDPLGTAVGRSAKGMAGWKSANAGSSPTGRNWPILTRPGNGLQLSSVAQVSYARQAGVGTTEQQLLYMQPPADRCGVPGKRPDPLGH